MTDGPLRYVVLLKNPGQLDPAKIAEVLAEHYRIPLHDSARRARAAWGIIAEDVEESEGKALASKLETAGLGSVVLPKNLIEELPAPQPACQAEFLQDALQVLPKSGERALLPWNKLALIAAVAFKEITVKKVRKEESPSMGQKLASLGIALTTGLPIHIGGKKRTIEKTQETAETVFYVDLYEREPLRRYRIDAQDFNYACLRERMQYSSVVNFRLLIETLARKAPSAERSRGARALIENKPVSAMGYDSLQDLDRESRWLLTLAALRDP